MKWVIIFPFFKDMYVNINSELFNKPNFMKKLKEIHITKMHSFNSTILDGHCTVQLTCARNIESTSICTVRAKNR